MRVMSEIVPAARRARGSEMGSAQVLGHRTQSYLGAQAMDATSQDPVLKYSRGLVRMYRRGNPSAGRQEDWPSVS